MPVKAVVHCKVEPYDLYIGRASGDIPRSKWANPFPLTDEKWRLQVAAEYEQYILETPELFHSLYELDGLVLGCWCAPKLCHGNVLADMLEFLESLDYIREDDWPMLLLARNSSNTACLTTHGIHRL